MHNPESQGDRQLSPVERLRNLVKDKPFLSAREIVELGLVASASSLYKWRKDGTGPAYIRLSPGRHLYPTDELISWFQSCYFPRNTTSHPDHESSCTGKKREVPM